jgi:ABC-2 type transport system ATP-binding protein
MEGVSRRYGDVAAVDDISLQVNPGTILGVIGPSGSGKTTVIRMLTGTLEPTAGSLTVLGQTPRKFTRHAREKIGYMPQHFVLYEELTARENLSFVASLFGLLWPTRGRRVNQMLKVVDLWEARGRRARQRSTIRCCCLSTSRPPGSIRCCARRSGPSSAACAKWVARWS